MGFFLTIWTTTMQAPFDISADLDTPVSAYIKLADFEPCFLLESVEGGTRLARYSFSRARSQRIYRARFRGAQSQRRSRRASDRRRRLARIVARCDRRRAGTRAEHPGAPVRRRSRRCVGLRCRALFRAPAGKPQRAQAGAADGARRATLVADLRSSDAPRGAAARRLHS